MTFECIPPIVTKIEVECTLAPSLTGGRSFIARVESASRKFPVDRNFSRRSLAGGGYAVTPMASNNLINQSVSDRLKSTNGSRYRQNGSVYSLLVPPPAPAPRVPSSHSRRFAYSNGPGSVPESINGRSGSSLLKTTALPWICQESKKLY